MTEVVPLRKSSGRPKESRGKLNEEMMERLFEARSSGMTNTGTARACGIDKRTFSNWRRRGETEEGTIYAELVARLDQADALFELHHLKAIAEAKSGWQAHAWLLERTMQERYALIQRVETGEPGAFEKLTDAELEAEIVRLTPKAKRDGATPSRTEPA